MLVASGRNRPPVLRLIIIKNNIIIIIRTFPESFSPEKFSLGNKFVNFKRSRLLRHVMCAQTMKYLSYQTLCDDVISHVTMSRNVVLAYSGNRSLSI